MSQPFNIFEKFVYSLLYNDKNIICFKFHENRTKFKNLDFFSQSPVTTRHKPTVQYFWKICLYFALEWQDDYLFWVSSKLDKIEKLRFFCHSPVTNQTFDIFENFINSLLYNDKKINCFKFHQNWTKLKNLDFSANHP